MLNQVVIVGRVVKYQNKENETTMTLACPRSFKNTDGKYDTDLIKITIAGYVAEKTMEYCGKGDVIGIKGRIQQKGNGIELIAEKVTFLSTHKEDDNEEQN